MLELEESSTINLLSNHDTWNLVEHREPGPVFTNRCFKNYVPLLYNTQPKTIRQLENIETYKKRLKTYIFSETFDFESKPFCDCFVM